MRPARDPRQPALPDPDLSAWLRERMDAQNVIQAQIGRTTNRAQSWVNQYLLGAPNQALRRLWVNEPEHFASLADLLGVTPSDLLTRMGVCQGASATLDPLPTPPGVSDAPTTYRYRVDHDDAPTPIARGDTLAIESTTPDDLRAGDLALLDGPDGYRVTRIEERDGDTLTMLDADGTPQALGSDARVIGRVVGRYERLDS